MFKMKKGFTLVEIMIVVAIIALLAAIAIPNLLTARKTANEAAAQANLKTISTAAEVFATANSGTYPSEELSLTTNTIYLNRSYDGLTIQGYHYTCYYDPSGYTFVATPLPNLGTRTFTITTGGVLTGF